MRHLITILLFLYLTNGYGQPQELNVQIQKSDTTYTISDFKVEPIDSINNMSEFIGIYSEWTLALLIDYENKKIIIPIDSFAHSVLIQLEPNVPGYCNRILYYSSCDKLNWSDHGNGCTTMNTITINCCEENGGYEIDGQRTSINPFTYKKSRKKKKKNYR